MAIQVWHNGHLTEAILEEYAFGRLEENESAIVEEHYLACETCREALDVVEDQIAVIRTAFAREARELTLPPAGKRDMAVSWAAGVWQEYRMAFGSGVLAIACIVVMVALQPHPEPASAPVVLASFRGGKDLTMAHAPAWHPLDLTIDATEVPPAVSCRIEVVNGSGDAAWNGSALPAEGKVLAHVPRGLKAGQYWVRLYGPDAGLVREFGLRLD